MGGAGSGNHNKKDVDMDLALRMIRAGFVDTEVCRVIGISRQALYNRRKQRPELEHDIQAAKDAADERVERSMYERACGYEHPEDKIFLGPGGEPVIVKTTKHYPPDTVSCIFWLKNRRNNRWKDKQDHELTMSKEMLASIINQLPTGLADEVRGKLAESLPAPGNC